YEGIADAGDQRYELRTAERYRQGQHQDRCTTATGGAQAEPAARGSAEARRKAEALILLVLLSGSQRLGLPSPRPLSLVRRPNADIDDALIRLPKCLGDLADRLFDHVGRGIAAAGKSKRHQNLAGSKVQSRYLVEAGDAADPRQSLLEPLHHNGRDRLAGDQAARLVGEHKGDARKQEADGDRRQAISPRDVKEACGDHAGRRKANADQRGGILEEDRKQGGVLRCLDEVPQPGGPSAHYASVFTIGDAKRCALEHSSDCQHSNAVQGEITGSGLRIWRTPS